jgi:hypothetical protein
MNFHRKLLQRLALEGKDKAQMLLNSRPGTIPVAAYELAQLVLQLLAESDSKSKAVQPDDNPWEDYIFDYDKEDF